MTARPGTSTFRWPMGRPFAAIVVLFMVVSCAQSAQTVPSASASANSSPVAAPACSNSTFTCAPAAVGATPTPTPTPLAGVLDAHFGIIYSGTWRDVGVRTPPLVRREGETTVAVGELAPSVPYRNAFYGTVSPDGHRAVYFAQPPNEPWGLYLLDGARPNEQRRLATIPRESPYGRPIWASDGA